MNKFLMTMCAGLSLAASAADKPNVIFMLTDDLGYSDIGCYGAKTVKTPNIDRLAETGLKFTDFYTGASICSPSRAAFLTGAYPQRCGLYMGINQNRAAHWYLGLNLDEEILPEQFRKQGYKTYMIGKWHLGAEPEFAPLKQGFDSYYGLKDNCSHSPAFFEQDEIIMKKTPLDQLTTLYTERIKKIVAESKDEPFFLYFAQNFPHSPFPKQARPAFHKSSQGGVRGDIIQELDWGVGEMMKALEAAGIAENTIVIFTSDNGATSNKHCQPFKGAKFVSMEGGHRVPFIVHWPAKIKEAKVIDTNVLAMDLFPTLSEIIGQPLPADRIYDGVSILPLLNGEDISRPETAPFYYYNSENLQAVRVGKWKLHLPRELKQTPFWDRGSFKDLKTPILYNIETDQSETTDEAGQNPEIVDQLMKLADEKRLELGEYRKRGTGQRATGSLYPDVPVWQVSNDWVKEVDPETQAEMAAEQEKRHPGHRISTVQGSNNGVKATKNKKKRKKKAE